jgi:hypothetical protein
VPQRYEVDEVIRMEMADEDPAQLARLDRGRECRKRALAEIEKESLIPVPQQVRGASRSPAIRVGRTRPKDGQLHGRSGVIPTA